MSDPPTPPTPPAPPGDPPQPPAPTPPPPTPPAPLTDEERTKLTNAAASEREARQTAERTNKELQKQLDDLRKANMTDQEKAVAEAKAAGAKEALDSVRMRLFGAEVRAAAAGKVVDATLFTQAEVALNLLGLTEVPVDAAGNIDSAKVTAAVEAFVKERPYLAPTGTPAPPGSGDGGPRPTPGSEPDFDKMTDAEFDKWRHENDPRYRERAAWAGGQRPA